MENNKTGLWPIFKREIRWITREPSFILMTLVFPLLMFFLLISMFGKGVPRDMPIGIYDADNSQLSREIIRKLDAAPSLRFAYDISSLEEAKKFLIQGKIYSFLYIEKNFEKNLKRGLPSNIIQYYNNENQLVGGTIFRDITATIKSISTEILKDNLGKLKLSKQDIDAIAEPIVINTTVLFNPYTNYMYYLLSGLLPTMLQFFIILCSIYTIGIELKRKTIENAMKIGNMSLLNVIIGKLLPYTIIFSMLGMLMIILMFKFLQFPLNGDIKLIVLATFLFVFSYQAVALFFVGLTGRLLTSMTFASFYASTAFTFVGMTYPLVSMYWPAKVWAQILPLTHYLNIIVEQGFRGSPANVTAQSFFFLILFLLLPFLVISRLKTFFTDKTYWGDWGEI